MEYSGTNFRSIVDSKEISFSINFSIDSPTGVAAFGFSGDDNNVSFKLDKGRIVDPENRYVHSYQTDNDTSLSGNISGKNYNYFINNEPVCFIGERTDFTGQRFFVNTTGCNIDIKNLIIYSEPFSYDASFQNEFLAGGTITGIISGLDSNKNFKIFSGDVVTPTGFTLSEFESGDRKSSKITINAPGNIEVYDLFRLETVFYTNFGKINRSFNTACIPASPYTTNLSLLDLFQRAGSFSGLSNTGTALFSDVSGEKTGDYVLVYDSYLNNVEVTGAKEIDVSFEYFSGNTGTYHRLTGIEVVSGGSGFKHPIHVKASGEYTKIEPLFSPVATFSVESAEITGSGDGYSSAPTINFAGGLGGNGAAATALVNDGKITGITIVSGGTGYRNPPTINFNGGNPTVAAQAVARLGNGVIESIRLSKEGLYFSGQPILSGITGSGNLGSGADVDFKFTSYEKTFFNSWEFFTGLYSGLNSATADNFTSFADHYNEAKFHNSANNYLNSGESLAIRIRNINFYDSDPMAGLLKISGLGEKFIEKLLTGAM